MKVSIVTAGALAALLAAGAAAAQQTLDQNRSLCRNQTGRITPELVIRACTTIAESNASAEDRSTALSNRGIALAGMLKTQEALKDFDSAIALDDKNAEAFNIRGQALADAGKVDQALSDFDRAIALDNGYAAAFYNRGNAYTAKGDFAAAIASFDRAVALNPIDIAALTNRALAYEMVDEYDRAIADYESLMKFIPNGGDAYYGRGRMRFQLGRFAEAADDFARAAEGSAANPYYAMWLQIAAARAGRNEQARVASVTGRLDLDGWPGPVLKNMLGRMSLDAVLAAARDPDPETQQGQLCEAYFYLGELALARGERAEGERLLKLAIGTAQSGFSEFRAAQAELTRLAAR